MEHVDFEPADDNDSVAGHSEDSNDVTQEEEPVTLDWATAADRDVILHDKKKVALEKIKFDLLATQGQPRWLTDAGVAKRKKCFMDNPPTLLVRPLLWAPQ